CCRDGRSPWTVAPPRRCRCARWRRAPPASCSVHNLCGVRRIARFSWSETGGAPKPAWAAPGPRPTLRAGPPPGAPRPAAAAASPPLFAARGGRPGAPACPRDPDGDALVLRRAAEPGRGLRIAADADATAGEGGLQWRAIVPARGTWTTTVTVDAFA